MDSTSPPWWPSSKPPPNSLTAFWDASGRQDRALVASALVKAYRLYSTSEGVERAMRVSVRLLFSRLTTHLRLSAGNSFMLPTFLSAIYVCCTSDSQLLTQFVSSGAVSPLLAIISHPQTPISAQQHALLVLIVVSQHPQISPETDPRILVTLCKSALRMRDARTLSLVNELVGCAAFAPLNTLARVVRALLAAVVAGSSAGVMLFSAWVGGMLRNVGESERSIVLRGGEADPGAVEAGPDGSDPVVSDAERSLLHLGPLLPTLAAAAALGGRLTSAQGGLPVATACSRVRSVWMSQLHTFSACASTGVFVLRDEVGEVVPLSTVVDAVAACIMLGEEVDETSHDGLPPLGPSARKRSAASFVRHAKGFAGGGLLLLVVHAVGVDILRSAVGGCDSVRESGTELAEAMSIVGDGSTMPGMSSATMLGDPRRGSGGGGHPVGSSKSVAYQAPSMIATQVPSALPSAPEGDAQPKSVSDKGPTAAEVQKSATQVKVIRAMRRLTRRISRRPSVVGYEPTPAVSTLLRLLPDLPEGDVAAVLSHISSADAVTAHAEKKETPSLLPSAVVEQITGRTEKKVSLRRGTRCSVAGADGDKNGEAVGEHCGVDPQIEPVTARSTVRRMSTARRLSLACELPQAHPTEVAVSPAQGLIARVGCDVLCGATRVPCDRVLLREIDAFVVRYLSSMLVVMTNARLDDDCVKSADLATAFLSLLSHDDATLRVESAGLVRHLMLQWPSAHPARVAMAEALLGTSSSADARVVVGSSSPFPHISGLLDPRVMVRAGSETGMLSQVNPLPVLEGDGNDDLSDGSADGPHVAGSLPLSLMPDGPAPTVTLTRSELHSLDTKAAAECYEVLADTSNQQWRVGWAAYGGACRAALEALVAKGDAASKSTFHVQYRKRPSVVNVVSEVPRRPSVVRKAVTAIHPQGGRRVAALLDGTSLSALPRTPQEIFLREQRRGVVSLGEQVGTGAALEFLIGEAAAEDAKEAEVMRAVQLAMNQAEGARESQGSDLDSEVSRAGDAPPVVDTAAQMSDDDTTSSASDMVVTKTIDPVAYSTALRTAGAELGRAIDLLSPDARFDLVGKFASLQRQQQRTRVAKVEPAARIGSRCSSLSSMPSCRDGKRGDDDLFEVIEDARNIASLARCRSPLFVDIQSSRKAGWGQSRERATPLRTRTASRGPKAHPSMSPLEALVVDGISPASPPSQAGSCDSSPQMMGTRAHPPSRGPRAGMRRTGTGRVLHVDSMIKEKGGGGGRSGTSPSPGSRTQLLPSTGGMGLGPLALPAHLAHSFEMTGPVAPLTSPLHPSSSGAASPVLLPQLPAQRSPSFSGAAPPSPPALSGFALTSPVRGRSLYGASAFNPSAHATPIVAPASTRQRTLSRHASRAGANMTSLRPSAAAAVSAMMDALTAAAPQVRSVA